MINTLWMNDFEKYLNIKINLKCCNFLTLFVFTVLLKLFKNLFIWNKTIFLLNDVRNDTSLKCQSQHYALAIPLPPNHTRTTTFGEGIRHSNLSTEKVNHKMEKSQSQILSAKSLLMFLSFEGALRNLETDTR